MNLPFYKEGAFCRSPRTLKSSFTYTNMLLTSNPNRSVLINKSLINSKKHISEEDLSDEFSFDQTPQEIINGSILGSIRSNLFETAERGISETTTRRDRSNNLSLDMNKGIFIGSESRHPNFEREHFKGMSIGGFNPHHHPVNNHTLNTNPGFGISMKSQKPLFMKRPKGKLDMKLNLSKIVKANSFDRAPLGFESLSYADFQKLDTKKLEHGHNVKMEFPVTQLTSTNRSQPNGDNKFSIPITTDNDRANTDSVKFSANQTLNSFVNQLESGRPISSYRIFQNDNSMSLTEAYENLKKENQDLKKNKDDLIQKVFAFEKENEEMIRQVAVAESENKTLLIRIKGLENQNEQLCSLHKKLENQANKQVLQLQRVLEPYKDKEKNESNSPMIRENSSFEELVQMVQEKLKKFEEMTKVDMNARILEKFDNLREYYRVIYCFDRALNKFF